MGVFKLAPTDAIREGEKQIRCAGDFNHLVTELYSLLDELLKTGYTSPAARDIHSKIQAKRPILNSVVKTLNNYGTFLINSAKATVRTDDSIADGSKI